MKDQQSCKTKDKRILVIRAFNQVTRLVVAISLLAKNFCAFGVGGHVDWYRKIFTAGAWSTVTGPEKMSRLGFIQDPLQSPCRTETPAKACKVAATVQQFPTGSHWPYVHSLMRTRSTSCFIEVNWQRSPYFSHFQ